MWEEIFSLWLALWLHYSKITHVVPVKPLIYLKGTISAGVNNKDSLNLKWLDMLYFIGHGMTTQLGWRGLGSWGCTANSTAQAIASVVWEIRFLERAFHLQKATFFCVSSFHILCKFNKCTPAKTKSDPAVALWRPRRLSWTMSCLAQNSA